MTLSSQTGDSPVDCSIFAGQRRVKSTVTYRMFLKIGVGIDPGQCLSYVNSYFWNGPNKIAHGWRGNTTDNERRLRNPVYCARIHVSKRRPDSPGSKFVVTHSLRLTFRLFSPGNRDDLLEDFAPHLLDRHAVQNHSGIDIHIIDLSLIH